MILIQIIIAILLTAVILLQPHGSGTSLLGGSGTPYRSKQGAEKLLFFFTILLIVLFVTLGIVNILT